MTSSPRDAKTLPVVFAVHRIDDKVYFEIPRTLRSTDARQAESSRGRRGELGRQVARIASSLGPPRQQGLPMAGLNSISAARQGDPASRRFRNLATIIYSFQVEAEAKIARR